MEQTNDLGELAPSRHTVKIIASDPKQPGVFLALYDIDGYGDLPGGGVEYVDAEGRYETPEEAANREFREETGWRLRDGTLQLITTLTDPLGYPWLTIFTAEVEVAGDIQLSKEDGHVGHGWIRTIDNLRFHPDDEAKAQAGIAQLALKGAGVGFGEPTQISSRIHIHRRDL